MKLKIAWLPPMMAIGLVSFFVWAFGIGWYRVSQSTSYYDDKYLISTTVMHNVGIIYSANDWVDSLTKERQLYQCALADSFINKMKHKMSYTKQHK